MPLVPYTVNGRVRLALLEGGRVTGEAAEKFAEEQARMGVILKRRMYYAGEQYDAQNLAAARACGVDLDAGERLPEHERLNAYSTQIAESVDFIADQLSDGFRLEAEDATVQSLIESMVDATDALSAGEEDGDDEGISCDDVLTDALVAGDTPYEMRWDPIEGLAWPEFWASEQVQIDVPKGKTVEKVTLRTVEWENDPEYGTDDENRQVQKRFVYSMQINPAGVMECRKDEFWDSEDAPRDSVWLGLPLIPWGLLRANKRGLRAYRGESVIKDRALDNADRYDAVEQTAWLIARYNSHGNLAVMGDAALIEIKEKGGVSKDVADVLTFPSGTQAISITLPTDPQMIEHQRKVCSDAIYQTFGLTRVEPDTLQGLGAVSGYALEILNRKTEGTFRRVRRQWRKDWLSMIGLMLDVTAWKQDAPLAVLNVEDGSLTPVDVEADDFVLDSLGPTGLPIVQFWLVDPDVVYPDRAIKVQMGSGYIVDDVALRDDYTAKLISRRYALEQRGLATDVVDEIIKEIGEEVPAETSTFGVVPSTKTGAGSTVGGSTAR